MVSSHHSFSSQPEEVAERTIDGMYLPTGRYEKERFTGGVKNGPALALGAFNQRVLMFKGTHGFLHGILMLLNRVGHAIHGLTDLIEIGKSQRIDSGSFLSLTQPLGCAREPLKLLLEGTR